jgi:hypothetical protein
LSRISHDFKIPVLVCSIICWPKNYLSRDCCYRVAQIHYHFSGHHSQWLYQSPYIAKLYNQTNWSCMGERECHFCPYSTICTGPPLLLFCVGLAIHWQGRESAYRNAEVAACPYDGQRAWIIFKIPTYSGGIQSNYRLGKWINAGYLYIWGQELVFFGHNTRNIIYTYVCMT